MSSLLGTPLFFDKTNRPLHGYYEGQSEQLLIFTIAAQLRWILRRKEPSSSQGPCERVGGRGTSSLNLSPSTIISSLHLELRKFAGDHDQAY